MHLVCLNMFACSSRTEKCSDWQAIKHFIKLTLVQAIQLKRNYVTYQMEPVMCVLIMDVNDRRVIYICRHLIIFLQEILS